MCVCVCMCAHLGVSAYADRMYSFYLYICTAGIEPSIYLLSGPEDVFRHAIVFLHYVLVAIAFGITKLRNQKSGRVGFARFGADKLEIRQVGKNALRPRWSRRVAVKFGNVRLVVRRPHDFVRAAILAGYLKGLHLAVVVIDARLSGVAIVEGAKRLSQFAVRQQDVAGDRVHRGELWPIAWNLRQLSCKPNDTEPVRCTRSQAGSLSAVVVEFICSGKVAKLRRPSHSSYVSNLEIRQQLLKFTTWRILSSRTLGR